MSSWLLLLVILSLLSVSVFTLLPDSASLGNAALSRRAWMGASLCTAASVWPILSAHAIPMITTDEFTTILRDSSRSISRVELSGPRSETVIVKLVDGSSFGLSDIVESSTDPRSPLRIVALCREYGVAAKFTDLERALASSPKKQRAYTNARVQEAQQKEKEKEERLKQDEEKRLEALFKLEQEEASRQE